MTFNNRAFLYGPLIAGGVFLLVWFFIWRAGADAIREGLQQFASHQREAGVGVTHGPLKASGYPFFLRGEIVGFQIARNDDEYRAAELHLHALPYAPGKLILAPRGDQAVAIDGKAWSVATKDARASIEKDKSRGWVAKGETGALAAEAGGERLRIERGLVNVAPAERGAGAVDVSLRVFGLRHEAPARVLDIARLDAALTIEGEGRGRALVVRGLEIEISESLLRADGTLSLDDQGRLVGKLDAELSNPAAFARAAGAAGLVSPDDARAAEAGFAMLAVAGGGAIRAPLEFRDGEARLAGVRIARAPKVAGVQP